VALRRTALGLALVVLSALLSIALARDGLSTVVDLDGHRVDPLAPSAARGGTVLVFVRTDCPIANRLLPTVERLRAAYEPKGVRFWLVFVDPAEPVAAIRTHLTTYDQHATAIRDPRHELVKMIGATRTPEAAVFVHEGPGRGALRAPWRKSRLVYRGRIDNRYVDVGRMRPKATSHDLQNALDAALAGDVTGPPRITQPVGCIIADLE
jgi:Redoxin